MPVVSLAFELDAGADDALVLLLASWGLLWRVRCRCDSEIIVILGTI